MITDIFIPEKIGTYYLVSKRIIGFDITKTYVYASQIYLSGKIISLEKFYQEPINTDATRPYVERVSEAIKSIMNQAPRCDEIRTALSSTTAVFKELTLPFIDVEKITAVLNFEIEHYLPFSTQEAVVDFVITHVNTTEKTSNIFVAAVQKQYIAEHLSYFEEAGYSPQVITIDLFDLYGLYREIPAYRANKVVALIDIESNVTRIAFIVDQQLKLTRTIAKGINTIARKIAQDQNIPHSKVLEDLIRFGLEKHEDSVYRSAAEQAMNGYFKEIQFTLQSFITQTKEQKIDTIFLLGRGSEVHNIEQYIRAALNTDCILFDGNELLKTASVQMKSAARIPLTNIMSLSTAFPSSLMERFNLRQKEFSFPKAPLFYAQFFTGISLILFIFIFLFTHSYWQTYRLKSLARSMEQSVVARLRDLGLTDAKEFSKALKDAEEKVEREEELWFAFSHQARFSFLKTLQDLSTAIDRKGIGLNLKKLIITAHEITLEGEIKGFEELKTFERELHASKLFSFVPTLQELKFNIKLSLKKTNEVQQ
jgi:type IV pilus assembly protein PilM